jgi:hypothetical protein
MSFGMSRPSEIFYSIQNGDWNNPNTWETVSGRVGKLPTAIDDVYVKHNVAINAVNLSCFNLFVSSSGTFSGSQAFVVRGNVQCTGVWAHTGATSLSGLNNFIDKTRQIGLARIAYFGRGRQAIMDLNYNEISIGSQDRETVGEKYLTANTTCSTISAPNSFNQYGYFNVGSFDLTVTGGLSVAGSQAKLEGASPHHLIQANSGEFCYIHLANNSRGTSRNAYFIQNTFDTGVNGVAAGAARTSSYLCTTGDVNGGIFLSYNEDSNFIPAVLDISAAEGYAAAGTANPGGRASAGWYNNQRNIGLFPIVPPTIRLAGGSATANTAGRISFTATNAIILDSIFTSSYSHYRIIFNTTTTSGNAALITRFTTNGTPNTTSAYFGASNYGASNGGFAGYTTTNPQAYGVVNELIASGYTNLKTTSILDLNVETNGTTFYHMSKWFPVTFSGFLTGGYLFNSASTAFDGIQFTTLTSADLTGTVQVFGYNN